VKDALGTLHVLIAADKRKRTGKTIREVDGKAVATDAGHSFKFRWELVEVDREGEWLEVLRGQSDRFPIIGSPAADWASGSKKRRLKRSKGDSPASIRDTPCIMLPIDVDRLAIEIECDIRDGPNVARQVMQHLGIDLKTQGFWHFTSSHALPGKGVRIRLWIVLAQALTAREMKALAKRLWDGKVDSSIYSANAEIFTADPIFRDGVKDPMKGRDRSGALEGATPWSVPVTTGDAEPKRRPGRPRKNPYDRIRETLIAAGVYIADAGGGTHHILCQFEDDHSGEPKEGDTLYLEAGTDGFAKPRLFCHHDHCKERKDYHDEFMRHLGLDRDLSVDDFRFVTTTGTFILLPIRASIVESGVNAMLPAIRVGDGEFISPAAHIRRKLYVTTLTWAPGRDVILAGEAWTDSGPIYGEELSSLNTYLPPQRDAPQGGFDRIRKSAAPYVWHVRRVFSEDWSYVLDALAFKVQNPGVKINHALVFEGVPGIGKDTILVPVKHAVGMHNTESVGPRELVDRFNKFERSVLCVINETSDAGDMNKYKFYEHTKAMFAAPPENRRIDEKNLGAYYVPNVTFCVITTNSAKESLYIPADDRRLYIASSRISRKEDIDQDGYFDDLYDWLDRKGGKDAAADFLMTLDVSHFNPTRPPPRTQAWWNVVEAGNSEDDVDLRNTLEGLRWPRALRFDELVKRVPMLGHGLTDRKILGYKLGRLDRAYVVCANPDAQDGVWKVGKEKKRVTYYALRELTVRERIAAVRERIVASKSHMKGGDDDLL